MATIPDSIKAQLDADWTAAGGTEPTYYVHEDYRTSPPLGKDAVWILSYTLTTDTRPVNDTYADHYHTIDLIVNTQTDEDRLKELADEVVRILNTTAITGATYQRIKSRKNISSQKTFNYQERITVDIREQMATSASAYGSGTTGDFAVVGNLTVGGTAEVTGVTTFADESLTSTQISDLLMFGSANAAWVPCHLEMWDPDDKAEMTNIGTLINIDNTTLYITYRLPLPTVKGSLKLYISGTRVSLADADAGDYITSTKLEGEATYGKTTLDTDATAKNTAGLWTDTFTAIDMSSYYSTMIRLQTVCTNAGDLDIQYVLARCYYA